MLLIQVERPVITLEECSLFRRELVCCQGQSTRQAKAALAPQEVKIMGKEEALTVTSVGLM